jgi:hypothetical protein
MTDIVLGKVFEPAVNIIDVLDLPQFLAFKKHEVLASGCLKSIKHFVVLNFPFKMKSPDLRLTWRKALNSKYILCGLRVIRSRAKILL